MSEWLVWMGGAGILLVLEMFTGTFYLLMLGMGFAAGGLAALVGAGGGVQLMVAAAVGAGATYALRRSKAGRSRRVDAAHDPAVNMDIGQTVMIESWQRRGNGYVARTSYRGADWDVELAPDGLAQPGAFIIREVRGNRLIVASSASH